jgi:hypothetical protein
VGRPTPPANCSKQSEPHSADTSYSSTCRSPGRTCPGHELAGLDLPPQQRGELLVQRARVGRVESHCRSLHLLVCTHRLTTSCAELDTWTVCSPRPPGAHRDPSMALAGRAGLRDGDDSTTARRMVRRQGAPSPTTTQRAGQRRFRLLCLRQPQALVRGVRPPGRRSPARRAAAPIKPDRTRFTTCAALRSYPARTEAESLLGSLDRWKGR